MRKWVRRVLLSALVLVALALSVGLIYERLSRREAAREYPAPGQLVEYDGRSSHVFCTGEGSPTVVLEAGLGVTGALAWRDVQPGIAAFSRVCSYDRAGMMWSEPRDEPRDARRIADELHGILETAPESPPYVMVGHSLGGLLVRMYTDRYPDEVAGVVLVDAAHPEQFDRYPAAVLEYRAQLESSLPPRWILRLLSTTGIYRGVMLSSTDNSVSAYLPRTVPWGFSGELAARDAMSEQAAATGDLGDRPLVVLAAGTEPDLPGVPKEVRERASDIRMELQIELAALSTNSVQRIVEDAGHNIHNDDPEAVVAAVQDVVKAVRQGSPIGGGGDS